MHLDGYTCDVRPDVYLYLRSVMKIVFFSYDVTSTLLCEISTQNVTQTYVNADLVYPKGYDTFEILYTIYIIPFHLGTTVLEYI